MTPPIRSLHPEDLERMTTLMLLAWKDTVDPRSSGHRLTLEEMRSIFVEDSNTVGWVLEQGGKLVASVYVTPKAFFTTIAPPTLRSGWFHSREKCFAIATPSSREVFRPWLNTSAKCFRAGVWWVRGLAVHPDWRGQGLAKTLMNHIEKQALEHGILELLLAVGQYNRRPLPMYEKMGYTPIPDAIYPFGSQTPSSAQVLRKILEPNFSRSQP